MNTWKVIGYIFLGCGTIVLIYAALAFFGIISVTSQIPYIGQTLSSFALAAVTPYLILAAIMYVIGGVSYYAGREYETTPLRYSNEAEITADDIPYRLERLERIVDNNFGVITERLDEIEEKQNIISQSTIIKARKE